MSILLLKSRLAQNGGLEKYALRLARSFAEKNGSVTILTSGDLELQDPAIKIITSPLDAKLSFRRVQKFDSFCKSYIEQHPATIVFGMDRNRFQTHLRAGNGVHAAYLQKRKETDSFLKRLSYPLNPLHRLLLKIEKESFENPALKLLFVNSHMVKEEILSHYRVDPKKIEVVHNGVEWKEWEKDFQKWQEEKERLASELKISPSSYQFVFIGHNFRRKGLDNLLEALPLLASKEFHLTVVGRDKNLTSYQTLVQKLKLEKQVSFVGPRSDVRRFYQLADALVIPSHYDPFANVTVEALAMGVRVISSLSNGGHEVLTEENGIKIASLTKEEISNALQRALSKPKTKESADKIRASCAPLDFSHQLALITDRCLT